MSFEARVKIINYVVRIIVSIVIAFICIGLLAFEINDKLKDLWVFLLSLSLSNVLNNSLKSKDLTAKTSIFPAIDIDEVDAPLLKSKDGKQKKFISDDTSTVHRQSMAMDK